MYTMRPAEFQYHRPGSLDQALALLGEESRPLAGGHSLLPLMKMRLSTPEALVDLADVPGLDGISEDGDGLRVGALAMHASVAESELVRSRCPVLAETAALIGDPQVRNRGTLGGSVAHADPAADYPTILTALGATLSVTGENGEREIAADDFFVGMFATALQPGELVVAAKVPATPAGTGAAYVKHRHPASFYAVVGVAAVVAVENGSCTNARLTIGGVTGSPVDATAAAEAVVGTPPSDESAAAAADTVAQALPNAMSDTYASGEYRTYLAGVLAKRALEIAFDRAS
jgi:carbon-monoxide dehydrogenase medium subunit